MDAVSFESITVSIVAIGFTAGLLAAVPIPLEASVSVEAGATGLRYRVDGVDPTAAEGHLLQDEDAVIVSGRADLTRFRAIRAGAVDATLRVTYSA